MEVALAVNVVDVEGFETILAKLTDKVCGVFTDQRRVTDVETSYEPLAVQRINVAYKLLGAGAGGVVDLESTRLLPHVFHSNLYAIFLAIGLERVVKLHIPLKKLLGNTTLAVFKVLNGVNHHERNAEIARQKAECRSSRT